MDKNGLKYIMIILKIIFNFMIKYFNAIKDDIQDEFDFHLAEDHDDSKYFFMNSLYLNFEISMSVSFSDVKRIKIF